MESDDLADALLILSGAKYRILADMDGVKYRHLEAWRCVANAYDHLWRQSRESYGLERRGDPCYQFGD